MSRLIRRVLHASCLGIVLGTPLAVQAAEPATRPAGAPATQPATQPADAKPAEAKPKLSEQFLEGQRRQRDNAKNQGFNNGDTTEVNLSDLIKLSVEQGVLKAEIQASPVPNQAQRSKVKGSNAIWTTTRSTFAQQQLINNVWVRTTTSNVTLNRIETDAKEDAEIWSTQVSMTGNSLSIRGQSVLGYVYFSQIMRPVARPGMAAPPAVNLTVQEWAPMNNGGGIRINMSTRISAGSISELRTRFPDEFRKHALPLLAKLSDLSFLVPGATDVYAVFSEIPADPQVSATVDALLPDLDSDAFAVREAASKQLLELGPPAVLAVLRKDLSQLSDEQRAQIGRLIAAHRRRADLVPAEARKDPSFLTDCLEHPDVAVRQAAKASLEKLLGETISLDVKLPPNKLGEAVDTLRKKVIEMQTAGATTQPAQPGNDPAQPGALIAPAVRPQVLVK